MNIDIMVNFIQRVFSSEKNLSEVKNPGHPLRRTSVQVLKGENMKSYQVNTSRGKDSKNEYNKIKEKRRNSH
ncbi:hypothetical protein H311_04224, partial [Anncaliia algerae PRA109]